MLVAVGIGVGEGVDVAVAVGSGVGENVGVAVSVREGVGVGEGIGVNVADGSTVGGGVGVLLCPVHPTTAKNVNRTDSPTYAATRINRCRDSRYISA